MMEETTKKLKLFHERAVRLKENNDFFVNISVNLNYHQGEGVKVSLKGPSPQTVKAFLLDFRPFIANDEPVSFNHVCNLVEQEVSDDSIKEEVRKHREDWNKLLERKEFRPVGGMRLKINSKELLSEENLKIWLNSDYFHLDKEGREQLQQMQKTPFGQLSHFALLDLLQRLAAVLFSFDQKVINPILEQ